jgi:hypothetical protein
MRNALSGNHDGRFRFPLLTSSASSNNFACSPRPPLSNNFPRRLIARRLGGDRPGSNVIVRRHEQRAGEVGRGRGEDKVRVGFTGSADAITFSAGRVRRVFPTWYQLIRLTSGADAGSRVYVIPLGVPLHEGYLTVQWWYRPHASRQRWNAFHDVQLIALSGNSLFV